MTSFARRGAGTPNLLGIDVRFFTGPLDVKYEPDETALACPDDYHGLPEKTRCIAQWVVAKVYNHVFLCDTDTFLIPSRLLKSGYEPYDYAGKIDRPLNETFPYTAVDRDGGQHTYQRCYPWASGGYGYFLSRKAVGIVAETKPTSWAEDLSVGQMMGWRHVSGEILTLDTPGDVYSWHFPSHRYKSGYDLKFGWMESMYEAQK